MKKLIDNLRIYFSGWHLLLKLFRAFEAAIFRFPTVFINNLVWIYAGIQLNNKNIADFQQEYLTRLLFCSLVGFPLFLSIALLKERENFNTRKRFAADILGVVLLSVLFFSLTPPSSKIQNIWLFALSLSAAILLLSFVNFFSRYTDNSFWHFNRLLIERFFRSLLYVFILTLGILIAFAALKVLFYIELAERIYGNIFILLLGLFANTYFLAGIPKDIEALEQETRYPQQFVPLIAFVLFPLLLLYTIILYAYLLKIAVKWSLPNGSLAVFVLTYALLGLATLLMSYPIHRALSSRWMFWLIRFFFPLLLPLLLLNLLGIYVRIYSYGWTETRYMIFLVTVWLVIISLYFILSKRRLLSVLPFSLLFCLIFALVSPWNLFAVALDSQRKELIKILQKSGGIDANGIVRIGKPFEWNIIQQERLQSIITFFEQRRRLDMLAPLFPKTMDTLFATQYSEAHQSRVLKRTLQLTNDDLSENTLSQEHLLRLHSGDESSSLAIQGYDFLIRIDCKNCSEAFHEPIQLLNRGVYVINYPHRHQHYITLQQENWMLRIDMNPLLEAIVSKAIRNQASTPWQQLVLPPASLTLIQEGEDYQTKLIISQMDIVMSDDQILYIKHLNADLLVRFLR